MILKSKLSRGMFIACIYTLLMLGVIGQVVIKEDSLKGETQKESKTEVSFQNIWNGDWQFAFENFIKGNLQIRQWLIPIRNQFMYRILKTSPNSNIVIGKNHNLYEEEYICFETQIFAPMTKDEIEILVEKLKVLDKSFKDKGKKFFIFITPSKAEIYQEDIPDRYLRIAPDEKAPSTYSLFIEAINQTNIAYYDSIPDVRELKQTAEFHVFPKTGTHWSKVTAAICAKNLSDSMEEQLEIDLPECTVQYRECVEPVHPDSDIYNLLNLLEKPDEIFYEPIVEITDKTKNDYSILARGGSFMGASLHSLILNDYFANSYYLENTFANCPEGMYSGNFDTYDILPIKEMIENSDIIFLEVNEEAIPRMSFGFIDYLLENKML